MREILGPLAAGLVALAGAARGESPEGDWIGMMKTPTYGDLTMALHLRKATGGYEGTMDDITLGYRDLALKGVEAAGERLAFDVPAARARFEATWDAAASQWAGVWKAPGVEHGLALRLARGVCPPNPSLPGLDGEWDGILSLGGSNLRLAFHIKSGANGTVATFDSVDQGAYGGGVSSIGRDGDHVRLEMKQIGASFDADLMDGGQMLAGQFAQAGATSLLQLKRLPPGVASPWPRGTGPSTSATPANWTPHPMRKSARCSPGASTPVTGASGWWSA